MKTVFIYTFFFILSFVFMSLSQRCLSTSKGIKIKFNIPFFLFSFCCLLFLLFSRIGADYYSYLFLIENARKISFTSIEPVFSILCLFFNFIFNNNYAATYFMLTVIALIVYYISFFLLRNDVDLKYCLLAFELFAFLRFYLVAMHLASALLLLSFVLLYKNKNILGIIVWVMASLIHTSGFFLAAAYFIYLLLRNKKRINIRTLLVISIPFILMAVFSERIYWIGIQIIRSMNQYGVYGIISNYSGSGITEYIIYIPLFYYFYRIYTQKDNYTNSNIFLFYIIILNGFIFAILGYKFEVISRMYEFFMAIYILIIPLYLQKSKNTILTGNTVSSTYTANYIVEKIFFIIYIILRGLVITYGILRQGSTSQMMGWEFYWPF